MSASNFKSFGQAIEAAPVTGHWTSLWFEQASEALFLFDLDRRILAANAVARQELLASNYVRSQDGRLFGVTAHIDQILCNVCRKPVTTFAVWRSDHCEGLIGAKFDGVDGLLSLTLRRIGDHSQDPVICIGPAHDLTPAEERVLALILRDKSADEVANILGISVETARTHRKRIYAKIGVNSRSALMTYVARLFM